MIIMIMVMANDDDATFTPQPETHSVSFGMPVGSNGFSGSW